MYFVVRPSTRQRRLVPVPAAVWRTGFLAGYEPGLDATAVALGTDSVVSTVLVLPGQQGQVGHVFFFTQIILLVSKNCLRDVFGKNKRSHITTLVLGMDIAWIHNLFTFIRRL